ncbi:MAG TPA: type IV pilin [Candidatus Thermoplasmatota archaeon]|nr:type IV pilin [Candidatus Thermoplasmatota archaeon]
MRAADAAVTEVLGTVLLLAVAVALVGGFVVVLFTLPAPTPEPRADVGAYVLPTAPGTLVVEHRGGEAIALSRLVMTVRVDEVEVRSTIADRLAAGDPAWAVVDAAGVAKDASGSFAPGDRIRYMDAALPGAALEVALGDVETGAALLGALRVQAADVAAPLVAGARTTSTSSILVTFSEPLASLEADDLSVSAATVLAAHLLGDGSTAALTTSAFAASATPTVAAAAPDGTRDLAGLLLAASSVIATDGAAPTISAVSHGVPAAESATVTWTTDEPANATVYFGPTYALGRAAAGGSATSHAVVLPDLTELTLWHYVVASTDAAGNTALAAVATFLTADDAVSNGTGGAGAPVDHLAFSLAPASVDAGSPSSTFRVALLDADGAAVVPASPVAVVLSSTSADGSFLDASGTTAIGSVTIAAPASTADFLYIDRRADGATSVVRADATGILPAATAVDVTSHGLVPAAGDTADSLLARVVYPGAEARNRAATLGVLLLNPTSTPMTVDKVQVAAAPALGTGANAFFGASLALGTGSDGAWSCAPAGSASNTATCDPADLVVPAHGMTQLVFTFTTSNLNGVASTVLTATFTLASPAATVTSPPSTVRHTANGQFVQLVPLSGPGGSVRASYAATAGAPSDLWMRWTFTSGSGSLVTTIAVPAGWSDVSAPTQAELANVVVHIRQPTAEEEGVVLIHQGIGGAGTSRELFLRATPPDAAGAHLLRFEVEDNAGTYGASFDVGVAAS